MPIWGCARHASSAIIIFLRSSRPYAFSCAFLFSLAFTPHGVEVDSAKALSIALTIPLTMPITYYGF